MQIMAGSIWQKCLRALGKALVVLACLTVILFLWVTISFNRAQPSSAEWKEASLLATQLEEFISKGDEIVFARASRGSITIEVYGLMDPGEQNRSIEKLGKVLTANPFQGKVTLNFYPIREYHSTIENGRRVDHLIKKPAFREQRLQP